MDEQDGRFDVCPVLFSTTCKDGDRPAKSMPLRRISTPAHLRRHCRGCKFASSLASLSGEELFSTVGVKLSDRTRLSAFDSATAARGRNGRVVPASQSRADAPPHFSSLPAQEIFICGLDA